MHVKSYGKTGALILGDGPGEEVPGRKKICAGLIKRFITRNTISGFVKDDIMFLQIQGAVVYIKCNLSRPFRPLPE